MNVCLHRTPKRRRAHAQRGVTLVELMVGLVIGMVVAAGLALLLGDTGQNAAELDKSVRQIENGRYAVDSLQEDISMAGYYGPPATATTSASISPCSTGSVVITDLETRRAASPATFPNGIEGLSPQAAADLGCLTAHKAGTPALIVHRLDTTTATTATLQAGAIYVQTSDSASDVNPTYRAGNTTASFTLHALDGSINVVRRYISRVYYVATCNVCGVDTIPTLKRLDLRGNTLEIGAIAEGVEQVGFDFGFDTDGNGTVDSVLGLNGNAGSTEVAAAEALGWGNVISVTAHVVTRASSASSGFTSDTRTYSTGLQGSATTVVGPFTDNIKRRAYSMTVRLNNLAGRREQP
jgi:type IV pilus assembly protein PilW